MGVNALSEYQMEILDFIDNFYQISSFFIGVTIFLILTVIVHFVYKHFNSLF